MFLLLGDLGIGKIRVPFSRISPWMKTRGNSYFPVAGVSLAYHPQLRGHYHQGVFLPLNNSMIESNNIIEASVHISHHCPHRTTSPRGEILLQPDIRQLSIKGAACHQLSRHRNTTQHGKRKIVSSDGDTYVVKKENKSGSILWRRSNLYYEQQDFVLSHHS